MRNKRIDMTRGSVLAGVLLFALPIVLGNVLQQLYTTADALVIGNCCSSISLAAVGTSTQPVEVILCLFLGIGSGVSILVSQEVGRGDGEALKRTVDSASAFVYLCGVPVTLAGVAAAPLLLRMMAVPEEVFGEALIYTRLVFAGTLGTIGYNMNAGVLRGMGDSRASLLFLLASCVMNIVLDLLLVAGLGAGVAGAALATTVSVLFSWGISIFYMKKKIPEQCGSFLPHRPDGKTLAQILRLGLPVGINNSVFSFGHMALQTMVNAQGADFMAGIAVAGRITGVSNIAVTALSSAAATFSGQNYGAGRLERLRDGQVRLPAVCGGITLAVGLVTILIRMPVLRLFTREDMVLLYASRYVMAMLLSHWCYAVMNTIIWYVNGVGLMRFTMTVNLLMLWAVRVPCAWLISRFGDGTMIMLCYPVSFVFGMICMVSYALFSREWKSVLAGRKL